VALSHDGSYKVEYHHIHPRARLKDTYGKAEINDLANLAFISDKANRKISARPPAVYFDELDADDLTRHFVPTEPDLRTVERYPDLVARRRALLATAMNDVLESYRPAMLDAVEPAEQDDAGLSMLAIQAYGTSEAAGDIVLVLTAKSGAHAWQDTLMFGSIQGALEDLADGVGSELIVGRESINLPADSTEIALPMGPALVTGGLDEWRKVLERELDNLLPADELPAVPEPPVWDGPRVNVWVLDTD